ncbi:hypothetical protein [Laceyella putida]|uniref:Uncharacterized protein n=1 Tax=Laceyella putida TaxID=110101 RepID=A0ABW2RQ55_9BACL
MNTLSTILFIVGGLLLIVAKVELGNRDGNYVDAMIELNRPKEDKEKSSKYAFWLAVSGLVLIAIGIILSAYF